MARPEENKTIKFLDLEELNIIKIYRHLDSSNRKLIRRTIKNLDKHYCGWADDTSAKVTMHTIQESDLLNSYRALNETQKKELLEEMHTQILSNPQKPKNEEYSNEEKKLIQNYRKLNSSGQKLIKQTIETLNSTAAGGEQLKTNFNS